MFGKSVFEGALSVLLSSVCERSAAACCKWHISNRLHVQSVSRRGSAWRRAMQRHAPSRYSSGLREAQLYCDTAPGHTEHGLWQTDRHTIYYAVYNIIFDKFWPAIGRHLNSNRYRWELLWLCMCSECAVLFVKTVCAVYSLWSSSGLWPTPCSVSCCAADCLCDVTHFRQDTARRLSTDCPQTVHRLSTDSL